MFKAPALICLVALSLAVTPAPASVAGTWNVSLELGVIAGHPSIELKQDGEKITGTYRGRYGAAPLEGTVKEKEIAFSVTFNAEGQQTTGYFVGIVDGDAMSGDVELEGAGEGTWSAKRAPVKK